MSQPNTNSVNFYILPDSDLHKRLLFVYRLVEKASKQRLKTLIIGADEAQLTSLDRLIWTAKPAVFIAHEVVSESLQPPLPEVLLVSGIEQLTNLDFTPEVVIDLSYNSAPLNFPKVMLVANQHQEVLPNARMKYQAYVDNGIKPTVHNMQA